MANPAYVSAWWREFSEETMADGFRALLEAVPFSAKRPGIHSLILRAISPAETPLFELDLRSLPAGAVDAIAMVREQLHSDTSLELRAWWDLWTFDLAGSRWEHGPQPVSIFCNGEDFDDCAATDTGHFFADIGFEHLFTGHAQLLSSSSHRAAPQDVTEMDFLAHMAEPAHLNEYREKTRENVRALLAWVAQVQKLPAVRACRVWSEGEENLEAKLDEIVALR